MITRKIGLAALLGLMSVFAFSAPVLAGPCDSGTLIDWDADAFAYETNYANLNSNAGSQLTMVGIINLFCAPLNVNNPNDPGKEYTFYFQGLISQGTNIIPVGTVTIYDTQYTQGQFFIFESSPRNSPGATTPMPANPPNGSVPLNFVDGTVIVQGDLNNFNTTVAIGGAGGPTGNFRGDYRFTGGTQFALVAGQTDGLFNGLWCAPVIADGSICDVQPGYSAHPDGKFDQSEATPAANSTWGAIKAMYR
jgi:hypothetical protein